MDNDGGEKRAGSTLRERLDPCQKIFERKYAVDDCSDLFDNFLDAILEARLSKDEVVDADRNFTTTGRIDMVNNENRSA